MSDHLPQTVASSVPNKPSTPTSLSPGLYQMPVAEVEAALAEAPVTADWYPWAFRAVVSAFYVEDTSDKGRQGWIAAWHAVLSDLPAPFVNEAFVRVLRKKTSRPAPAEVRMEAQSLMESARLRVDRTPRYHPEPEPTGPIVGPEEQARVVAMLKRAQQKLRWRKTHGRSDPEDVPTRPRRRSDAEIQAIIDANPARHGQTVASFRAAEEAV